MCPEIWWGFEEDVKNNIILENYQYIRENHKNCKFIFGVYHTRNLWGTVLGEATQLQPIFKHLMPQPDPSTPINIDGVSSNNLTNKVTDLVTSTKNLTGASHDGWKLPTKIDTPKVRDGIARAIARGFIKPTSTGFDWIRPTRKGEGINTLIALLFGIVCCEDEVKPSRYGDKWVLGTGLFPDEEVKEMFGLKSLGAIRINNLDSSREKSAPRGWHDIVDLFD